MNSPFVSLGSNLRSIFVNLYRLFTRWLFTRWLLDFLKNILTNLYNVTRDPICQWLKISIYIVVDQLYQQLKVPFFFCSISKLLWSILVLNKYLHSLPSNNRQAMDLTLERSFQVSIVWDLSVVSFIVWLFLIFNCSTFDNGFFSFFSSLLAVHWLTLLPESWTVTPSRDSSVIGLMVHILLFKLALSKKSWL